LDELLKEDPVMRKHIEDNSVLPRKYWNLLFEIAILLLPFGSLVDFWGAPWVGLILRLIGAVMLPPLWVARYKLFGMPRDEMKTSIKGWALWFIGSIVSILGGYIGLIGTVMMITGLMMIYANGVYLERGTRFWLVIALYIGIPLYIYGSSLLGQLSDMGAFNKAQPFGSDYGIVAAEYGALPEEYPRLNLDQFNVLRIDGVRVGEFSYVKPQEEQAAQGIWHAVPKDVPGGLYKLEVDTDGKTTLAYFLDDQLQWRWEIRKIPIVHFMLRNDSHNVAAQMDWFPAAGQPEAPEEYNHLKLTGSGNAWIQFHDDTVTVLTIREEYHHGDQSEIHTYRLEKDKNDEFPFPEILGKRYEGDGQYAVYTIEWEGGTYWFRVIFG